MVLSSIVSFQQSPHDSAAQVYSRFSLSLSLCHSRLPYLTPSSLSTTLELCKQCRYPCCFYSIHSIFPFGNTVHTSHHYLIVLTMIRCTNFFPLPSFLSVLLLIIFVSSLLSNEALLITKDNH